VQVTIHSSGVKLESDYEQKINRKLQLTLSRVEPYLNTVLIHFYSSANSGGITNVHCRLTLTIANQADVVIEDKQMTLDCVIDRVLQKASRMIERLVFNM